MSNKLVQLKDAEGNNIYPNVFLDLFYPVGSIYLSVSGVDPSATIGGTWVQLPNSNYATKQWPASKTTTASGATTSTTLTITTSGNPVFLSFDGDINTVGAYSTWVKVGILRGNVVLGQHIAQSVAASSYNETFSVTCIDPVPAGTYTYTFKVQSGNGSFDLNEDGTNPCNCSAFEMGADTLFVKWQRTA